MERALDFVAVGDILVDMVAREAGPLERAGGFERCFGGAPANFAVGVQRLGARAGLVAKVGSDPFGVFLRRTLEEEGVDASQVTSCKERTSLAFVGPGADFLFYRGADVELDETDVLEPYIAQARFLHFSGFTLSSRKPMRAVVRAVRIARKHGLVVSFSVNYRADAWTEREAAAAYARVLPEVDVVIASEAEAGLLAGRAGLATALKLIARRGPSRVVATMGARGAALYEGGRAAFVPSFEVDAVDATGAGDGFSAGLMASLARGATLAEAGRFACAVGALVTTKRGAITAFPTREDVERFLSTARQRTASEVGSPLG